jgi:Tol biopolymer transport system component
MRMPDMQIRQLTSDPHTENFARISPDGKKVVFARSRQAWQSLRDKKPWNVWMIDIESGEEQLIAEWGMSPSWSPDGRFITYQRNPGMIMAYDLQTGQEKLYYESGKDPFMKARVDLLTPSIGTEQRMAFTFRDHGRPTNIIRDKDGDFEVVHSDSCQVLWAPSGDFVTYVQKGGRQTNQIMRFDPASKEKITLLDLPGELSHEYFPRLSHDEKYLIFAASGGGHEHDLADYELFVWPLGSDASDAVRLTFNAANDSWPDLWLRPSDS